MEIPFFLESKGPHLRLIDVASLGVPRAIVRTVRGECRIIPQRTMTFAGLLLDPDELWLRGNRGCLGIL
jgi:hypothetical protein